MLDLECDICRVCNLLVGFDQQGIFCDSCNTWFHSICEKISTKRYKELATSNQSWLCSDCERQKIQCMVAETSNGTCSVPRKQKCHWGSMDSIQQISQELDHCYNTIVTWRKKICLIPRVNASKKFICELTRLINLFNNNTVMKEVALIAVMVFMPMMLQKPARNSKAKDHCRYLEKRLHLWEQGKLDSILSECNEIQQRMIKAQTKEMSNLTRKFTNLMLLGKLSQASKLINRAIGGILCMNDEVKDQLLQKHPAANPLNLDAILSGPIQKPEEVIFESIDAEMVCKAIKLINGSGGPTLIDADCWKHVACSDSFNFKTVQRNLCDAMLV